MLPTDVTGDHELLRQFGHRLRNVIVFSIDYGSPAFPREVRASLLEARPAIDGRLETFIEQVSHLERNESERLDAAGLAGSELRLKLSGFNYWYAKLESAATEDQDVSPGMGLKRFFRGFFGLMPGRETVLGMASGAMKWANIVMGSIPASVIPGAEAVKEIKEVVEKAIEDADANELPSSGNIIFPPPQLPVA